MNNKNNKWTGAWLIAALIPSTIEMDMMVPSLPGMADFFQVDASTAQAVLSRYYQGLIVGLLLWGFGAERWGYKRTLLWGLFGIAVAALGCYSSDAWSNFLGWRFVQGVFAASPMVASLAFATRMYSGARERHFYGVMNASISFCLAVSPLIGAFFYQLTDWRSIYLLMALITCLVWIGCWCALHACPSQPLSLASYVQAMQRHVTRSFLLPSLFLSGVGAVYLLFMTTSTFVFQQYFALPTTTYIGYYALIIVSFTLTSCFAERLRLWFGSKDNFNRVCMALSFLCICGLWWVQDSPQLLTGLMCGYAIMNACLLPWFYASMMQCQPAHLGVSSALHNLIRFTLAAGLIGYQSWLFQGQPDTVIACMILAHILSVGIGLGYLSYCKQVSRYSSEPEDVLL